MSRKLAIRDEPNIRTRCSRHAKKQLVLPVKNTQRVPLNTSPRPPCVYSKRPRVCRHHAHMLKHVCVWWGTHGDVLSGHTGFSACHTHHTTHHTAHTAHHNKTQHNTTQHNTTHHNNTTQHNTTHHNNTTTTPHENRDRWRQRQTETDRDRERERETVKEDGDRKRREEKRREEREERRFIFSVVVHGRVHVVLCLPIPQLASQCQERFIFDLQCPLACQQF